MDSQQNKINTISFFQITKNVFLDVRWALALFLATPAGFG
jgi:hypothetical protein